VAEVRLTVVKSGSEFDEHPDGGFQMMRRYSTILELRAGPISSRRFKNGRWPTDPPGL
jgi:hypothetical protein